MNRILRKTLVAPLFVTLFLGCSDPAASEPDVIVDAGGDDATVSPAPITGPTTGGEDTTFDHDNNVDPFQLQERMEAEGPPEYRSRLHSCPKIKYRALGNLLASRGVNINATAETSAGFIYRNSDQALGVANYGARISETVQLTTASATKMFDLFVAAAPEIITNMPSRPECMLGDVGTTMFNAQGQCAVDGVTCLLGRPAKIEHMELCNQTITRASTPDLGRTIAVAALLSAAHTCE